VGVGAARLPGGVRSRFWEVLGRAGSVRSASALVGVSHSTGNRWIAEYARVRAEQPAGWRLSLAEREEIAIRKAEGWTVRRIAMELGRPPSTVGRELARNSQPGGRYRGVAADAAARGRAARPKPTKLGANPRLAGEVQARLSQYDSPEQIAGRLPADFPDDPSMRISHETIYQELYVRTRGTLTKELARCLRTGRTLRRDQRRAVSRPGPIPDMVLIADRPTEAAERTVAGHWEGDLICGSANKSAIGTLVELTTSLTLLVPLPEGHTAAQVQAGITQVFAQLPAHLRRSLTWDRGGEMASHKTLTQTTGTQVYFCDPHSPWQRPTNENTNGLLRQYFPKGTDLSVHSAEHIAAVQAQFNDRPRKRLGFKTPAEAFAELLSQPQNTSGVAITP
jgi:IS30 family transposase